MPKGACKTCMGRKVEYHSPAKHPEQGDAMSPEQMDQMVEDAASAPRAPIATPGR